MGRGLAAAFFVGELPNTVTTIYFLVLVLAALPAMALWSRRRLKSSKPLSPKPIRYITTIALFVFFFIVSRDTANANAIELFPQPHFRTADIVYCALICAAFLFSAVRSWSRLPAQQRLEKVRVLLPEKLSHLPYWLGISLGAGIAEEMMYRGVLVQLLFRYFDSLVIALLLSVLAFGAAHVTQGWKHGLGAAFLGIVFHLLVLSSGSIYPAMIVHAIYDFLLGVIIVLMLRRTPIVVENTIVAESGS